MNVSRITPGTMIVAIFAVMFGLVGAYVVKRSMQEKPVEPVKQAPPPRLVRFPRASMDLKPDKPLTVGDVSITPIKYDEITKGIENGTILPEPIDDPRQVVGRILRQEVTKGSAFQASMFYPEGTVPNVAERLKPGYRAVTVPIKDIGAVSGFAGPGSMVDVLFRSTADPEQGIPETMVTLVDAAEVLAVGQNYVTGTLGKANITMVTLAVTTDQSKALKVAEGRGDMSLSMRSPGGDVVANNMQAVTLEGLLGIQPRPGPAIVDIYRGADRQTLIFNPGRGRQIPQPPAPANPIAPPVNLDPGAAPPPPPPGAGVVPPAAEIAVPPGT
jgi:Flp pilus assembly protein CpaB